MALRYAASRQHIANSGWGVSARGSDDMGTKCFPGSPFGRPDVEHGLKSQCRLQRMLRW